VNQIIEVKIIKKKVNYVATSSLFPQSKGIGKTKREALKKLANSISSLISKMVNSTLSNVFLSSNYTQIMLDQTKEIHEENIAFNLNSSQGLVPKSFLLKVSSFTEEEGTDTLAEINETNDVNMLFDHSLDEDDFAVGEFDERDLYEQLTLQQKSSQDPDAIVFGFPLNFN
jgi:hypothetical protein